jgi:ABC-type amino acid transport substrate-binding protein
MAMVNSGIAEIGIGSFSVTKERSEVVAFTEILRSSR